MVEKSGKEVGGIQGGDSCFDPYFAVEDNYLGVDRR
jgi:hypothetical protein